MFALSEGAPSIITYPAALIAVTDGDTQRILIRPRPGHWVEEKVRLIGLDCDEARTERGKYATMMVEEWYRTEQPGPPYLWELKFNIFTHLDKRDKYGRLLGYVKKSRNGEELNQWIIDSELLKLTLPGGNLSKPWTPARFKKELGIKTL